jgi:hypothetical protein
MATSASLSDGTPHNVRSSRCVRKTTSASSKVVSPRTSRSPRATHAPDAIRRREAMPRWSEWKWVTTIPVKSETIRPACRRPAVR